ncbi:hypothetical protein [Novilysobacter spongiicola]|uniref:Adhesin n=1 Tax=Lysobacter spongiicola DSM 21749 TaxID=1122188 RepID=A0A1T4MG85_9GAMM|nr:hypothetical protein [Lysobacter spongiicola]SJZ65923.1 hypothetical protein SAMN02745674_00414 [Lysobacter spongiicola DSM 21749]
MRKTLLVCLMSLPFAAMAQSPCKHSTPYDLELDLEGVRKVTFEVRQHDLELTGRDARGGRLQGRACAGTEALLETLTVTQQKDGDHLVVSLESRERGGFSLFGNRYAHLELEGSIPRALDVDVRVGSGDAVVSGVGSLEARVGSGDLEARQIAGAVEATVGSGDIELERMASLEVGAVGSGDLEARTVEGDVRVGSIGSGDVALVQVGGSVEVGSIGSGDLQVENVGGALTVRSIGSGDVDHDGVAGSVDLPRGH